MDQTLIHAASLAPAVAEIWLVFAICVLLLVEVFAGAQRRGLTATLTLVALAIGAALTVRFGQVPQRVLLFDGSYAADELGVVLKLAGFLFVAVALLYSRAYLENRDIQRGEYYVLSLTALLGVFVLVSANSLVTVYLGVELLALSVYAMAAFDRDSGVSAEAAMKYFVLGAIAAQVHAPLSAGVVLGLTFIVVAVAFKLGAVPMKSVTLVGAPSYTSGSHM